MSKLLHVFRVLCVVFVLLMFFSCGETPPGITITSPQKKQEYFKDEDIDVKAIITDTKGKSFDVQLYIDNLFINEVSSSPYYFTIKAGTVLPGEHILKVTTAGAEDLRTIIIKDANYESANFVTFADGKIPPEWQVQGWRINTGDGFDDNFSLVTMSFGAKASTIKTCSKISFYLKGSGIIYLYMDSDKKPWKTIILPKGISPNQELQEWKFYEFDCLKSHHKFIWEFDLGTSAVLDVVRFEN